MSVRSVPSRVCLVVSAIYREEERFGEVLRALEGRFGQVARVSGPFPFDQTRYYESEMGAPLFRRFVVFGTTVSRDALAGAKLATEEIEVLFSREERREVNLDPGILSEENFLLATGKNYSHRVYLRDGVFADLTLVYRRGGYVPLPWTYPDYASGPVRAFLGELRAEFLKSKTGEGAPKCG